jgi:hypothetical protein
VRRIVSLGGILGLEAVAAAGDARQLLSKCIAPMINV